MRKDSVLQHVVRQFVAAPWAWLWIAVAIFIADFYTKVWASESLVYGWSRYVQPWLNWTLAHNTGAAFSFLHDAGGWQRWFFVAVGIVVSVCLLIWLKRLPSGSRWLPLAIVLLLGGAWGNLYDRAIQGYVVDFIHVHWSGWNFPAFNIADIGISIGATMLVIDSLFLEARRENKS